MLIREQIEEIYGLLNVAQCFEQMDVVKNKIDALRLRLNDEIRKEMIETYIYMYEEIRKETSRNNTLANMAANGYQF